MRRTITRFLAIVPSMVIAIGLGKPGINALLVGSQVVLSIVLPFVITPLLYLTSNEAMMSVRKTRTEMIANTAIDVRSEILLQSRDQDSNAAERADVDEMVDYSNNKFVIVVGVLSWLVIVAANVYVMVELGLSVQT